MTDKSRELLWTTGPGEILRHGLELLQKDSDTNRRVVMIGIDNAVELMMKIYLGLPKRVTGLTICRKEYQEISESFPGLLDVLETYAADKLAGLDLSVIQWYHRLRNELYHQGNGLTVERDKMAISAELANILFRNLFGYNLVEAPSPKTELLGNFIATWAELERALRENAARHPDGATATRSLRDTIKFLATRGELSARDVEQINQLRQLRNIAAYGQPDWEAKLTRDMLVRPRELVQRFSG